MPGGHSAFAKLSPPRLHPDVLARTRLFALLDEAAQRPVVWLHAPPGAGKTTLVAGWLAARQRLALWYQVDDGDADAASFVYYLKQAAQGLGGKAATLALPLLTPEYLRDLRGFARRFFRLLFARMVSGSVLVLDNFQEVPEEEGATFQRMVSEAMGCWAAKATTRSTAKTATTRSATRPATTPTTAATTTTPSKAASATTTSTPRPATTR